MKEIFDLQEEYRQKIKKIVLEKYKMPEHLFDYIFGTGKEDFIFRASDAFSIDDNWFHYNDEIKAYFKSLGSEDTVEEIADIFFNHY